MNKALALALFLAFPSVAFAANSEGKNGVGGSVSIGGGSGGAVFPAPSASPFPVAPAATFPVSVQGTVPVSSATTLPVAVQGSVPVTGAFFQATQPISGTVGISGTVPISSATTLPVAVQGSVPVTGAFFQATQPVSIAGTLPVAEQNPCTYNATLPTYTSGQTTQRQCDINGRQLNYGVLFAPSPLPVNVQPGALATTSGTISSANGYVKIPLNGASGFTIATAGTWSGSLDFRYSDDPNATVFGDLLYDFAGRSGTTGNLTTTIRTVHPYVEVIASSWTSGSVTVSLTPELSASGTVNGHDGRMPSVLLPNGDNANLPGLVTVNQNEIWDDTFGRWRKAASDTDSGAQIVTTGGRLYKLYAGGASTALTVKGTPGRLQKIINTNTSAQSVAFTCYDNATSASGLILWSGILAASQVVDIGIPSYNGIVCQAASATLSGNGINVTYE